MRSLLYTPDCSRQTVDEKKNATLYTLRALLTGNRAEETEDESGSTSEQVRFCFKRPKKIFVGTVLVLGCGACSCLLLSMWTPWQGYRLKE